MGNNNGLVSTMTHTRLFAVDGHNGDFLDDQVTWSGNLEPGTSLVIGGANSSALPSLVNLVQQWTGNPVAGFTACDTGNPVSCNETSSPTVYTTARLARNMFIGMEVNENVSWLAGG